MDKRGRVRLSWEETAVKLAFNIAEYRSQDLYVQVGCCGIKKDGTVVLGYNGPPPSIEIDWSDRDERRKKVIHAEENVLNEIRPDELKVFAVTHSPCCHCIRIIAKKLIKTVYFSEKRPDFKEMLVLAEEFGIRLIQLCPK